MKEIKEFQDIKCSTIEIEDNLSLYPWAKDNLIRDIAKEVSKEAVCSDGNMKEEIIELCNTATKEAIDDHIFYDLRPNIENMVNDCVKSNIDKIVNAVMDNILKKDSEIVDRLHRAVVKERCKRFEKIMDE